MTLLARRSVLAAGPAALLAGCSSKPDPHALRVAYSPIPLRPMYEALAAAFARAHPGLSVQLVPSPDYIEMWQRDVRLSLIGDELDVSHAGINVLRFYVDRGLAAPLDGFLKTDVNTEVTRHETIGVEKGVTYAIPFGLSVPVFYYNKDLMARAGVDPDSFDGSWSAILSAAARISRLPSPASGIFFDYSPSELAWEMLVYSRGGAMMSVDERRIAFAGEAGRWSVDTLRAIGRAGQPDFSSSNARIALTNGFLGFYQNTSANLRKFADQAQGIRLGMTVMPTTADGTLPAAGTLALIPARDPERRALAWKYVRFACSPPGQAILARKSGYVSLNRKAQQDPQGVGAVLRNDPLTAAIYQVLPKLRPWYVFPGPNSARIGLMISDLMRQVILGRIAPPEALRAMQARVAAMLAA